MLKSLNAQGNNYEASLDGKDLAQLRSDRRVHSKFKRDRKVLAIVNFNWYFNSGVPADNSQAEFCGENGTGVGRFAYIDSRNALATVKPMHFGKMVWECEQIGYGYGACSVSGQGPLVSVYAPILSPIRPRFDLSTPTVCGALKVVSSGTLTNSESGLLYTAVGGTQIKTTLGGTAYPSALLAYAPYGGSGGPFTNGAWLGFVQGNYFGYQPIPDSCLGHIRCGASTTGNFLLIEYNEPYRLTIYVANTTSGSASVAGVGTTAFTALLRGGGSTGPVTFTNTAMASALYAGANTGTIVVGALTCAMNNAADATISSNDTYISTASGTTITAGATALIVTQTVDTYGRTTALAITGWTGNISFLVEGGLPGV